MGGLLQAAIEQVLIPLVAGIVKAHFNATGQVPNAQQIQAAMPETAVLIAQATAWQASHPTPVPTA